MSYLFIGPISPPISGPGVKNKLIHDWLRLKGGESWLFLNTYDFRKFLFSKIFRGIKEFLFTRNIVLSVSKNGRFLLIPLCWLFSKSVILFPAGGTFDQEIENLSPLLRKLFLKTCKNVKIIYPETKALKAGLERLGFKNVIYFPNPRKNDRVHYSPYLGQKPFKIVFLSKIRAKKGVLLLIEALEVIRNTTNHNIEMNFYGVIEERFKDKFFSEINSRPNIQYKGIIKPIQVQSIIAENHLFILPTIYEGEGVPGALIEAMMTGVPIIISDFRASREIIADGVNGMVVPMNDVESLSHAIIDIIDNAKLSLQLSIEAKKTAEQFDIEVLMPRFINDLNNIK